MFAYYSKLLLGFESVMFPNTNRRRNIFLRHNNHFFQHLPSSCLFEYIQQGLTTRLHQVTIKNYQQRVKSIFPQIPLHLDFSVEIVVAPFAKPHWSSLLKVHVFVHQVGRIRVFIISFAKPNMPNAL